MSVNDKGNCFGKEIEIFSVASQTIAQKCRHLCDSSIFTAIIEALNSYRLSIAAKAAASQARGLAQTQQELSGMGTAGTGAKLGETEGEALACRQPD